MKRIYSLEYDETRKSAYRCTCNLCKSTMEIEANEFKYIGGLNLTWECEHCKRFINRENVLLLQKKKVVYGPTIRFDVEK